MKLIQGAAAINKAIASIQNRGAKLDGDIHLCGVSALAHASEHGDPSLCDKLVQAMPKGSRKLALVEWMLAYGQIVVLDKLDDAAAIKAGRVFALDRTKKLDLEAAMAKSWTGFRKDPAPATAFDAQKAVQSVLTRLNAASKAGVTVEHKAEALAQARALVAALEA